jgi:excisionase family DNA binding protein
MEEKYLTTFEAAKICHASPGSMVRWIREGKLKASVTAGGHHRISMSELVRFLKKLRMPVPKEMVSDSLIVSSNPQCLKQIQKMLRRRFPGVEIEKKS